VRGKREREKRKRKERGKREREKRERKERECRGYVLIILIAKMVCTTLSL
jgi:hypothetical protein